MTLFLAPDDGPFVFGAYAAHLDQSVPLRPSALLSSSLEVDDLTLATEDGLPAPVSPLSAERGLAS
jgi:hypothetical protein